MATKPALHAGQKAMCSRCNAKLFESKVNSIDRTLAISLAGLLFLIPAMTMPLMGMGLVGLFNQASMVDCIAILIQNDFYIIGLCLFLFTIAIPIVRLVTAFYIAYCIKRGRVKPQLLQFFRSYHTLDHWVMLHVFLLGIIVSMYKLLSMADLTVGLGFSAFVLLLLCSTLVSVTLDQHTMWETLEDACEHSNS
ncbi:paraquat-inducible protein A [Thalassotalea sp. PLHSN55]|uniref:paraquat-inducible protein A n=1 Tax=Thalassotalea sp. PLHSN55 TaxID=3435888 RepID=UPI003F876842